MGADPVFRIAHLPYEDAALGLSKVLPKDFKNWVSRQQSVELLTHQENAQLHA